MQGRKLPDVTFKTRVRDEAVGGDNPFRWQDVTTDEIFKGRRVVVFSLPGSLHPHLLQRTAPGLRAPLR
jgi:peroxiredoxin